MVYIVVFLNDIEIKLDEQIQWNLSKVDTTSAKNFVCLIEISASWRLVILDFSLNQSINSKDNCSLSIKLSAIFLQKFKIV